MTIGMLSTRVLRFTYGKYANNITADIIGLGWGYYWGNFNSKLS